MKNKITFTEIWLGITFLLFWASIGVVLYLIYKIFYAIFFVQGDLFIEAIFYCIILWLVSVINNLFSNWYFDAAKKYNQKFGYEEELEEIEKIEQEEQRKNRKQKKDNSLFSFKTIFNVILGIGLWNMLFGKDNDK